ncbi:ATP-binding protein [Geobacter sulfurreducens]|uniref:ATP-binding protein n=1 Tax=Geobacter sulfurreducens TaxID=35554 RepID=UPI000DBB883B|nr:ATP-binding protein [Geobacter sulfurreducens]BBA71029.1 hypothetical protein YM18_2511 [Geobacter sulfurreducens]
MSSEKTESVQGSLFEEDYLIRTLGNIAQQPDVALTELVANAWDAGASEVKIHIPLEKGKLLTIEDDGSGMAVEQFKRRWMTLAYDRLKHQGDKAEFPPERNTWRRWAYGRNGVGRHGLLCFADRYEVETWRDGIGGKFLISTQSGSNPFVLMHEQSISCKGHGTLLQATVQRHLPDADRIRDVLSARFLHDPNFTVFVNGKSVPLSDHPGLIDQTSIEVSDTIKLDAMFIDSSKAARTIQRQGIAFWVGGRLVGEPSWVLGNRLSADGRTHFAKRYTFVIKTDDIFNQVQPDWSGFKKSELMDQVYSAVDEHVRCMLAKVSTERIEDTKEAVYSEHTQEIRDLRPLARLEVKQFVEEITARNPTVQPEVLSIAVKAVINIEQARSGASLLKKLATLSEEDIDGINRLLDEWDVRDALTVLDEIDRRISVIEAIKRLSKDDKVDELKTLHPLITESRWLFGPEYDTPEYASNVSLVNAVEKVFGQKLEKQAFINPRKRPDLVVLHDASLGATAVEAFNDETGLSHLQHVMVIELKRGQKTIGRDEMTQATNYVEDLLGCGLLEGPPTIKAYVVGHALDDKTSHTRKIADNGFVHAATYGQLVRTAERRLFKLREKLVDRYDGLPDDILLSKSTDVEIQPILLQ